MSDTCPDCTHLKAAHSFVGCMADAADICGCEREFPEYAKATSPQRAEAEKVDGMAKAQRGTDPDWDQAATEAALDLARERSLLVGEGHLPSESAFTPDDVWALLEERQVPPPREPRALGPVLQRLTRAKRLTHTGYAASLRRHKSPVGLYLAGPEL